MVTQESAPGSGRFSTSNLTIVGNNTSTCSDPCAPGKDYSTIFGMAPGTTHIHPTRLAWVRGWAESQVLWCNMHNVQVGVRMAKLVALQLVQLVGARSTILNPINQKTKAPPPPSFPHTMLSVKMVKYNMCLIFIKKFFTNRKIVTKM
jgi:hypothetical protein